jgi:16S rRNA (cytidine1402-2'-O)-methyltransferase
MSASAFRKCLNLDPIQQMEFSVSDQAGKLYIVATPIGNLEDISARALTVLREVDLIAAEDTRHSKRLLSHYAITTPLRSYHDFNERQATLTLMESLRNGMQVALISDAGTPLISDPGYHLVNTAHELGIRVIPVPGPCAAITALSASGLPTDKFVFEGYAPEKQAARTARFQHLVQEVRTLVFYEAPHRIQGFLADAEAAFGPRRQATLARELTKRFETIRRGELGELRALVTREASWGKGEYVVIVHGAEVRHEEGDEEVQRVLTILLQELPLKKAAALAARITGRKKNELYALGLKLTSEE